MHIHPVKGAIESFSAPFVVIDDFLSPEVAQAMRADIDKHVAEPGNHRAETHQIWNYWFVPDIYTYLRTRPEKIIEHDKVGTFVDALRAWSIEKLGLGKISWPHLSLYVSGCRQGLHNDSRNGRFAFVYSLTRNERRTIGGQTMVFREHDLFRRNLQVANAGVGFYDLIEPRFNRLVVFDDRLVHGVERVEGSMDPAHGRWVLHGHIEEAGPIIAGALGIEMLRDVIREVMDQFVNDWSAAIQLYHGPLVLRLKILPAGRVAELAIILDRVIQQDGDVDWESLRTKLLEAISHAVFPAAGAETKVTLPITFGTPLRQQA
jgi:Rps23 Pro-64 3,4-dihydroxylase Tpa1-like proline 4-hydroxylase